MEKKKPRNSIFELGRIVALLFVFGGHWNSYIHLIAEDTYGGFAWFAVIMFALLTGYFYFNSPKVVFAERTFMGKKFGVSQNLVFRRAASRIVFGIIVGNIIAVIMHFAGLSHEGFQYFFVDDNWYIYALLIVSLVGALAQKIYWQTGRDFIFYVLIIIGILMIIVGFYYFDFDYQFRLGRQGMMTMCLGLGGMIAKATRRAKAYFSIALSIFSALLLGLKLSHVAPSALFPGGADASFVLLIFVSSILTFCLMQFMVMRSHFVNGVTQITQGILETHWIAVIIMRAIFKHDIEHHNATMLGLGFLIGAVMSIALSFPVYYLKTCVGDVYCEKYLFYIMEYANIIPRHLSKNYDKLMISGKNIYEKARDTQTKRKIIIVN